MASSKPKKVSTYGSNNNLFVLGQNRTVECRVTGARPTPAVKWFNNDYEIRGSTIQVNFYIKLCHLTNQLSIITSSEMIDILILASFNEEISFKTNI